MINGCLEAEFSHRCSRGEQRPMRGSFPCWSARSGPMMGQSRRGGLFPVAVLEATGDQRVQPSPLRCRQRTLDHFADERVSKQMIRGRGIDQMSSNCLVQQCRVTDIADHEIVLDRVSARLRRYRGECEERRKVAKPAPRAAESRR
jgi:hypothetical protein